jgi:uncharacterized protein
VLPPSPFVEANVGQAQDAAARDFGALGPRVCWALPFPDKARPATLEASSRLRPAASTPTTSLRILPAMTEPQDALIHACQYGLVDAFDEAVAAGADCRAPRALLAAAIDGHPEIVRKLLALGADINAVSGLGVSALAIAAANGHLEVIRLLLDAGADPEIYSEFNGAALHQAIEASRADAAMLLIERGANIHTPALWDSTALHMAVNRGETEVALALIDRGADIAARDDTGATALNHAAVNGRLDVVNALLAKGANVDARTGQGLTPLQQAIGTRQFEVAKVLLAHGADPKTLNDDGDSLLHTAVRSCRPPAVAFVLNLGLPLQTLRNGAGLTALELAQQLGSPEIVAMLSAL